jgi:hypothetical protein
MMRRLCLGFAIATMLLLMPKTGSADDQSIANRIMQGLQTAKQQGQLKGFQLDLKVEEGTAWFSGYVASEQQEALVFDIAQTARDLGLVQIVDEIEIQAPSSPAIAPVAYARQENAPNSIVGADAAQAFPTPAPLPMQAGGPTPASYGAPVPMGAYGGGPAPMMDHPNMPGHAWPAYAAYPNYAGVTYPGQYSAAAWPYIGPFYPYPQVPLGWRKVQLEWKNGWWYLDFKTR